MGVVAGAQAGERVAEYGSEEQYKREGGYVAVTVGAERHKAWCVYVCVCVLWVYVYVWARVYAPVCVLYVYALYVRMKACVCVWVRARVCFCACVREAGASVHN